MWLDPRKGSEEGAGPWGLAEQAEHLEICPSFQRYLDDIMPPYLLLLTSCTYISGTGIQPVKQGEPDGSACGHGRCRRVCVDGHWAVPVLPSQTRPGETCASLLYGQHFWRAHAHLEPLGHGVYVGVTATCGLLCRAA